MGTQATIDRSADAEQNDSANSRTGASRILYDFITLCEVQSTLIRADLRHVIRRLILVLAIFVGSLVLLSGATTILLVSACLGVVDALSFSLPVVLAVFGGVTTLIAAAGFWIAAKLANSIDQLFKQSSAELRRNIEAIKRGL
jgi:uncharacterized membrane protein YvlD (DUF360 family)